MSHFVIPSHSLCVFGPEPQSIVAISADGMFYKFALDEQTGNARRVVCESFLRASGDQDVWKKKNRREDKKTEEETNIQKERRRSIRKKESRKTLSLESTQTYTHMHTSKVQ